MSKKSRDFGSVTILRKKHADNIGAKFKVSNQGSPTDLSNFVRRKNLAARKSGSTEAKRAIARTDKVVRALRKASAKQPKAPAPAAEAKK